MRTLIRSMIVAALVATPFVAACGTDNDAATDTLPRCTAEDSSDTYPCLWDASEQGNGTGEDVILFGEN